MAQHSKAPISSAARIIQCNGSVPLEALNPETEQSEDARNGDAAHWIAATLLSDLKKFRQSRLFRPGTAAPNGVVIDDEMIEAADIFTSYVHDLVGSDALEAMHVEETIYAPAIHSECWGTPDVWWASVGAAGAIVHIPDFKYGHRFVDAFENWQCIGYGAAVLSRPEFSGIDRNQIQMNFHIIQPRNYHAAGPIRTWTTTAATLIPYWEQLTLAYAAAFSQSPLCMTGDECRDCRGRHYCPALAKAADNAMDFAGQSTPLNLTTEALAVELRMIHAAKKRLDARATGLEEQALSILRSGQRVPGFMLGQGQAREQWTVDADTVAAMADGFGIDVRKPPSVITPAQARKAGLDVEVVKAISTRPAGALKLEPVTDEKLRKVFG